MGNSPSFEPKKQGNFSAKLNYDSKSSSGVLKMDSTIRNFAQFLKMQAIADENVFGITFGAITKHICNDNASLGRCMFKQFCLLSGPSDDNIPSEILESLTIDQYIAASNSFIGLITDGEKLNFFAKGFANGDQIDRQQVMELVKAAYQMAHVHHPVMCDKAACAVVDAVMHNKERITVSYFTKWCKQHCHRLVDWMHRHLSYRLSSYSHKESQPDAEQAQEDPSDAANSIEFPVSTEKRPSIIAEEKSEELETAVEQEEQSSNFKKSLKKVSPKLSLKLKSSPTNSKKSSPENSVPGSPKQQRQQSAAPRRRKSVFSFRTANDQVQDPLPVVTPEGKAKRSMSVSNLALLSESCMQYSQEQTAPDKCDAAAVDTPILDGAVQSSLSPSLMWLLTCSLPLLYTKNGGTQESVGPQDRQRRVSLPTMSLVHGILQKQEAIHWEPLYISDRDGLGSNRFEHHALNYKGPTLMIVEAKDDDFAFCLAVDEEWRDSKNFWGGKDCLLIQIRPLYRIVDSEESMMYFNVNWRGFPTGIQVGKNYESRSLTINSDFSLMHHHNMPYKIGAIEVWGCGNRDVRVKQQEYKKVIVKDVERRRKVKMTSSEWLEHPDRYLLEMAGGRTSYVHQAHARPR